MRNGRRTGGLTVGDIMTREVVTVTEDHTLREVIDTLTAHGISGAPVLAGERIVGVISKSDIIDFIASTPPVPSETPQFVEWGELEEEQEREEEFEDVPRGFFTDLWDDAGADVVARFDETDRPEWDLLGDQTAGSVMTRKVELLGPSTPVRDAARQLIARGVHRVLIAEDGKLLGIVSTMDLAGVIARR